MKLITLYQVTLICIGISLMGVKAQDLSQDVEADNRLKCQRFSRQSDTLKADNENLKSHLQKMESTLQEQMQKESEIEKEFDQFEMKLKALETLLIQQQNQHLKGLKDTIGSLKVKKCKRRDSFLNDYQKFSKLQTTLSQKFDIELEMPPMSNDLDDEPLERDNEHFCSNFYLKTLEDLSGNITILQNIDEKLKKTSTKFIEESEKHKKTIEALPDVLGHLDKKDKSGLCVRTKDKSTICSKQPHPSSCVEYDSPHCSQSKCLIKNFIYGPEPFQVSCDQVTDGGGWTVIQRRINGSVDFYRDWSEYKMGFGDLDGEFWLGLDKLHALTTTLAPVELQIQLTDHDDVTKYALFSEFLIGNETELYELKKAEGYEGNVGDSFSQHVGQKFSTKDKDNDDSYSFNCADEKIGAWWYKSCHWSNLNGKYYNVSQIPGSLSGNGICWYDFHGYKYSLKSVQMMIRPMKNILSELDLQ